MSCLVTSKFAVSDVTVFVFDMYENWREYGFELYLFSVKL